MRIQMLNIQMCIQMHLYLLTNLLGTMAGNERLIIQVGHNGRRTQDNRLSTTTLTGSCTAISGRPTNWVVNLSCIPAVTISGISQSMATITIRLHSRMRPLFCVYCDNRRSRQKSTLSQGKQWQYESTMTFLSGTLDGYIHNSNVLIYQNLCKASGGRLERHAILHIYYHTEETLSLIVLFAICIEQYHPHIRQLKQSLSRCRCYLFNMSANTRRLNVQTLVD